MSRPILIAASPLLVAAVLSAQSFTYANFSSVDGLALLGNATQIGNVLRLTADASDQAGWVWRDAPVLVDNGFETHVMFRITPPPAGTRAEGLAFLVQDAPTGASSMGGGSWGIGYGRGPFASPGGLPRSLAIELDTYQDFFLGDSSANELSVHTRGAMPNHESESYSLGRYTPPMSLSDGQVHSLRIVYTPAPGLLEVFVDNAVTPGISVAYDLLAGGTYADGQPAPQLGLTGHEAFVGLCAATGSGVTQQVEILQWSVVSVPLTDSCYLGTLGTDTLRVEGQAGGPEREVALAAWDPFTIEIDNPPAFGPGAPYVLFASLQPLPGAFGTNLGFGSTCFPVLPAGPTELVLVDTIGLFPAVLPGAPTPHAVVLPAGTVPMPLQFTVQAVTFASLSPLELGITNAIDVAFGPAATPVVNSVVPLSAPVGTPIEVLGSGFIPGGSVLLLNGAPLPILTATPTRLTFAYPPGVSCDSTLVVFNPGSDLVSRAFNPGPAVTGTLLGTGPAVGGAIFVMSGSGFAAGTTVTIGGAPANVISVSATGITVQTPPGTPGQQLVVVSTPGTCSTTTTYTYQ